MDWQIMFNLLTGLASLILVLLGWWAHEIWDQVIKLKENINNVKVDLPTNYVPKVDMNDRFNKVDLQFEKVYSRLDNVASVLSSINVELGTKQNRP